MGTIFYMKNVNKKFVAVQPHTVPHYNQSGDMFRLITSHHQTLTFQELSIKSFIAIGNEKYMPVL